MKRLLLVPCLLALLAACGNGASQNGEIAQSIISSRNSPDFVPRFVDLIRAEAPVLQVGFIDNETSGSLLLERQDGPFAYWLSPDGAHIVLQDGMLHSVRGLGEGLLASDLSEPLALVRALRSGVSDRFHTYLDGNDRAITRTYRCQIENRGPRDVDLFGAPITTQLMREDCRSLDQEFVNLYWVNESSRVIVLSRQWVGPVVGVISTRIVPR